MVRKGDRSIQPGIGPEQPHRGAHGLLLSALSLAAIAFRRSAGT
jgi:hypothetical protein